MEAIESHHLIRVHRPETLSAQYKNGFGTTDSGDEPWPRGAVIYAGRGSPMVSGSPGQWKPGSRTRGPGSRNGIQCPGYNYYQYQGPPVRRPGYRSGYRGRRKPGTYYGGASNPNGFARPGGLGSAWHGSVPQGLQHCGFHAHRAHALAVDDGFIDDTLLTDLSQFSLQDDPNWDGDAILYDYSTGAESRLAMQAHTLAKDCASTPHLAQSTGIPSGRPKSVVHTRVRPDTESVAMSSSLSPTATSDASNPADRLSALCDQSDDPEATSSPEPQDSLSQEPLSSSRSLTALRSPVDFLTLVWDIST